MSKKNQYFELFESHFVCLREDQDPEIEPEDLLLHVDMFVDEARFLIQGSANEEIVQDYLEEFCTWKRIQSGNITTEDLPTIGRSFEWFLQISQLNQHKRLKVLRSLKW